MFTVRETAIIAALTAIGIIFAATFMYAAIEHQIHPDCATVLACVRL